MPRGAGAGVGLGVDHQHVGIGPVGDPHLGAVEHVAVAPLVGAQRACATTSEPAPGSLMASAPTCSPRDQLGQVLPLLLRRAVAADLVDAEVGVRAVGKPDRGRGAADLLHRDHVREIAHAGAAVLLLDGDAEQPERAELAPEIGGKIVGGIDLRRARRDLVGGEILHLAAQHLRGFAQIEIQSAHPVAHLVFPGFLTHFVM